MPIPIGSLIQNEAFGRLQSMFRAALVPASVISLQTVRIILAFPALWKNLFASLYQQRAKLSLHQSGRSCNFMCKAKYRCIPRPIATLIKRTQGAVLVVATGSSGGQITDELQRSGRTVFLCVGPHDRPPRAYRGHDYCWWLGVLGLWDIPAKAPCTAHVTISVSGARGGETVDFRRLSHEGMTLLGSASGFENVRLQIDGDLAENIAAGDANYLDMLAQSDAYVERFGLDLPLEPEAHVLPIDPDCLTNPIRKLDLVKEGITTVLWATG